MLINALAFRMEKSPDVKAFWEKLDSGEDGTLAVASSARPFMTAARFARSPQPTLVVVAGEDAAADFARNVAAYVGEENVLRFFERSDFPFNAKPSDPHQVACRMEALHALVEGQKAIVVASARSLLRCLPPVGNQPYLPLDFECGCDVGDSDHSDLTDYESIPFALEAAGYQNTGELDGPGTYCVRGGTVDVYPGNLHYPVRIDCFGDEVDEIRRIVPSTGQTISSLQRVRIYPVREFKPTQIGRASCRERV